MNRTLSRRQILKGIGTGTAILSLPGLVHGPALAAATPGASTAAGRPTTAFDEFGVDPGLLGRTLARGLSRGGDFCEVFLQHKITHMIAMEDGAVNRASTVVDLGAGIRVIKGDATGFAYCEELTEKALIATAETAAAVADGSPVATAAPFKVAPVASRYEIATPWTSVGVEKKLPLLEQTDRAARARDKRIVKVTVSLIDETSRILIANSDGLLTEDAQPYAVVSASCVAAHKGKTEMGFQSAGARDGLGFLTEALLRRVAHEAADWTVMLFDAVPPPIGEVPVVLAPGVTGILLHEAMGHGFEADFNRKGTSIYADRIGKRVAPEAVTVFDDAMVERSVGSINIDDEGTPGEKTVLVENGILRSYMHDRISSKHYRVKSTGSGRRQSFRFPPVPRMRNTYMASGPATPEEIIRSVQKGLYAEQFSNGQVNIGAGDFTFYLKHGRLIEGGKLTRVVKDANLIGSGPKVLENVKLVGSDLSMFSGGGACGKDGQSVPVGFGLPTILVGAISVGGRSS
ncbi:MAG: TldD/PmbA family protein [Candidatus Riflebacteria bacterium]|nr:TldD/PmbA family protein [Candidatus Riflebacteria bacterium]